MLCVIGIAMKTEKNGNHPILSVTFLALTLLCVIVTAMKNGKNGNQPTGKMGATVISQFYQLLYIPAHGINFK
jgi:hypothetical protein